MGSCIPSKGQQPLEITIVGGSSAGLIAGILLKRAGHNVTVLEQAATSSREGLAAGIGLTEHVKGFFEKHDRLAGHDLGTPSGGVRVLDTKSLEINKLFPLPARMTSWDAMYYRLRANFDGLVSAYCPSPPDFADDEGKGIFETGKKVLGVKASEDGRPSFAVENVLTSNVEIRLADLVIGADGANSSLRRHLLPSLHPRDEPGYMIWRGTVPSSQLDATTLAHFEGYTIIYPMKASYAVAYTIPGENGALGEGERHINVAWYVWTSSPEERATILTDINNHTHRTTLPKGQMKPEIWAKQVALAKEWMHPLVANLITKITHPFVSVISSLSASQGSFLDGRAFLIGDALVQCQPNTGQGTNLAAMEATTLAEMIVEHASGAKGSEFLAQQAWQQAAMEWSQRTLEIADSHRLRSKAFAADFLGTSAPEAQSQATL